MSNKPLTAIEFFSGIGAFAEASRNKPLEIIAAYDQNLIANQVYEANFNLKPLAKNIESLAADNIPQADIWWMSPPCTPFSRRGKRRDDEDPRALALLNLIDLIPRCLPSIIFMENVTGFIDSSTAGRLERTLADCRYQLQSTQLCASDFGVPMRRPRYFIAASRLSEAEAVRLEHNRPRKPVVGQDLKPLKPLKDYLFCHDDPALVLNPQEVERYRPVLNIVSPDDENACLICFTRGYYKCRKASGSLIQMDNGAVRFVSPEEILGLFGFSRQFAFPANIGNTERWKLVGNSVDVRSIGAVLESAGI